MIRWCACGEQYESGRIFADTAPLCSKCQRREGRGNGKNAPGLKQKRATGARLPAPEQCDLCGAELPDGSQMRAYRRRQQDESMTVRCAACRGR